MCPKRPIPPTVAAYDEYFEPIVYKLFTNFRMAGITPEQIPSPQRRRYSIFLDVCNSFPVAATMEMPLLSIDEIAARALSAEMDVDVDDDVEMPSANANGITDAARLLYDMKRESLLPQGLEHDLAKDWSHLVCAADSTCKLEDFEVEMLMAGDGPGGELPTCSNAASENSNSNDEAANDGCFEDAKVSDDELAGAVGGQQE